MRTSINRGWKHGPYFCKSQRHNAAQRSAHIREVVLAKGVELRERYPILQHQDALGAGILAFALVGMIGSATLYVTGHMAWWVCLLLNAFFASLTHELEHDLIHSMYFRKQRVPHNLMMGLVWLARPSTINPWIRRHLHLNHHKVSGTETDMEERAITNGEPWGFARLLMVGDNVMSAFIRMPRAKTWAHKINIIKRTLKVYAPLALLHWGAWYVFLGFHAANGVAYLVGSPIEWSATTLSVMQVIDIAAVVIIGRTCCAPFACTSSARTCITTATSRRATCCSNAKCSIRGGCGRCRRSASTSAAATAFIISW